MIDSLKVRHLNDSTFCPHECRGGRGHSSCHWGGKNPVNQGFQNFRRLKVKWLQNNFQVSDKLCSWIKLTSIKGLAPSGITVLAISLSNSIHAVE